MWYLALSFFDHRGRVGRAQFMLSLVILFAFLAPIATLPVYFQHVPVDNATLRTGAEYLLFFSWGLLTGCGIYAFYCACVKRCHDLNTTGWWLMPCTLLLPMLGFAVVALCVMPSVVGENQFEMEAALPGEPVAH